MNFHGMVLSKVYVFMVWCLFIPRDKFTLSFQAQQMDFMLCTCHTKNDRFPCH